MQPAREPENRAGGEELGARSLAVFWAWLMFMAASATSFIFYVGTGDVPGGLLVVDVLLLGTMWLFSRPPRPRRRLVKACDECGSPRFPTRHPEGMRLWTCFVCGRESARRRTYRDLYPTPAGPSTHAPA